MMWCNGVMCNSCDNKTILQASLGWSLYELSLESLKAESLPADWGLPLVWSFSALPVLPLLIGLLWFLTFGARGNIWIKVSSLSLSHLQLDNKLFQQIRGIVKPTSTWHRNHQMHNFGGDQTKVQSLAQT